MAPKRGIKRKDKSRVVLKKGESQRKDGTYDYRWTSRNGRRHSIYAQTLEELRIKEDAITRDEMDGIRAEARCTTLNELFEFAVTLPQAPNAMNMHKMTEAQLHEKLARGLADAEKGNLHDAAEVFARYREKRE